MLLILLFVLLLVLCFGVLLYLLKPTAIERAVAEQLGNMGANYLTDILRRVPGLRVNYGSDGEWVSSSRGFGRGCVQYWVDDIQWQSFTPGDINNFVTGREVVAVEVYQDATTPAQYMRAGGNCTTIVLWTRFKIRS